MNNKDLMKLMREKEEDIVKYDPSRNCINMGAGGHYQVTLDRIKTPADLLGWVYHLSDKTWVSKRLLRNLVSTVSRIKGWYIHGA